MALFRRRWTRLVQVLRLRVMDADLVGGDDDIGVAALPLKGVLAAGPGAKALHRLPVQDAGGGKGGGEVEVEVKYLPFTPLRAAAQAAAAAGGAGGVVGSVGAQLLSAALSAVARASEALQAESRRREWERDLWTVPPEGSWSVLAADSRPSSMPTEFEKARCARCASLLRGGAAFLSAPLFSAGDFLSARAIRCNCCRCASWRTQRRTRRRRCGATARGGRWWWRSGAPRWQS